MKNSIPDKFRLPASTDNITSGFTGNAQIKIALAIGNSRLHWGLFAGKTLQKTWDTEHLNADAVSRFSEEEKAEYLVQIVMRSIEEISSQNLLCLPATPAFSNPDTLSLVPLPLILASVVTQQTAIWQSYPDVRIITLDQLPIGGLYPTLGIDRALAVLGAGNQLGWPVLLIDAGTALTFTGADVNRYLVGGAILPGLGLQLSSLGKKTAALPLVNLPQNLPHRWATDTAGAIQSGVVYATVAGVRDFIEDWRCLFPDSKIAVTGGDRTMLLKYLTASFPDTAAGLIDAPEAIFWGISLLTVDC
ncbi:putative transcriptional acitvator, Baf family [Oscillatoria nigro-viridis PCC 7112]|uniref:Type III pantothenate kinase n=1 Tax=Phormidium nigroviride PCC 7112 TaxID=179408 RepID=K9VIL9_9CYAN|nr:pantothenate kinase [Oscillatoria nigro-viridis]AFZ07369.1 putative transcriptional acitvator, Baf family [Oscillatoria nigro-viridis PCC 7112]